MLIQADCIKIKKNYRDNTIHKKIRIRTERKLKILIILLKRIVSFFYIFTKCKMLSVHWEYFNFSYFLYRKELTRQFTFSIIFIIITKLSVFIVEFTILLD